jgi:hypothetical protein
MLMVIGLYLLRIECANQLGMNQKHRDYPRAPPFPPAKILVGLGSRHECGEIKFIDQTQ